MRRSEEKPGKEATRLHSEKHSCPRRRDTVTDEVVLCRCFRCEPERGGKAFWDAEQLDRDLASRWIPRMASEAFCPRKARVRPLRTGKHHIRLTWRSDGGRRQAHLDALVSHELLTSAPVLSAVPIPRSRSGAGPTGRGCSRTLIRRGFVVISPCHWHCWRNEQPRQSRILAL